jgi:hypothetical protein
MFFLLLCFFEFLHSKGGLELVNLDSCVSKMTLNLNSPACYTQLLGEQLWTRDNKSRHIGFFVPISQRSKLAATSFFWVLPDGLHHQLVKHTPLSD